MPFFAIKSSLCFSIKFRLNLYRFVSKSFACLQTIAAYFLASFLTEKKLYLYDTVSLSDAFALLSDRDNDFYLSSFFLNNYFRLTAGQKTLHSPLASCRTIPFQLLLKDSSSCRDRDTFLYIFYI